MMRNTYRSILLLIGFFTLAGCIKVELKDERTIPELYQVVLVTLTPEGGIPISPSPTLPPATLTTTPTQTATPTPTQTPLPTSTPATLSATPIPSAVVAMNAFCRTGPGIIYTGVGFLTAGEQVVLQGRNSDSTWWLVHKSDASKSCWASAVVLQLPEETPGISVVPAPPTPFKSLSIATATQRPRQKPPKPVQGTPVPTDTPNPYPYPSPYPAP